MPRLERSQWYDLSRDMNWEFKYVTEAEVFPEVLSHSHGIPAPGWWNWDEPYKISEELSEREIIEAALAATRGRVSGPSGAAAKLRIPPSTLETRIKALKINKGQFKFR